MSGPHKPPVETPREWFRYAEGDLRVAQNTMGAEEPPYHTVCFLCQGAAEKFLKGLLIAHGWSLVKTHDLTRLMDFGQTYGLDFGELRADGDLLNEYVTAGRYPGDLISAGGLGKAEAEEALAAVERIRARVMELMSAAKD
jgi:HEPN domain-containing protein